MGFRGSVLDFLGLNLSRLLNRDLYVLFRLESVCNELFQQINF